LRIAASSVPTNLASRRSPAGDLALGRDQLFDLGQEPGVDPGQLVDRGQRPAGAEGIGDVVHPIRTGLAQLPLQFEGALLAAGIETARIEPVGTGLQAAQRLLQRLLETAPDRHHLAHALHLRGQARIGFGKLLEGEARDLGHHVIDAGLERGRGPTAGDLVLQLVQGVAHGQLRRHLGDRETGRLRRQGTRARDPRIHLDHHQPSVLGIDAELDVRPAGIHPDFAQDRDRGIAHALVFLVGEGLRRRHGDGIPGVHPHRIEVLDRADDDAVVRTVADHLHLELLPTEHALFHQHLVYRREIEATADDLQEFLAVVGDPAARAAQGERGPDDGRVTDLGLRGQRLLQRSRDRGPRHRQPDLDHRLTEQFAILGQLDRLARGADQLDAKAFQDTMVGQIEGTVQRRLSAHGRQQGIRPLFFDDPRHRAPIDRLDVGGIGHVRIGHDRGGVGVHQHDAETLLAQRLARLRAGVVELAGLADHDRAGADDQDRMQIAALRHGGHPRPAPPASRPGSVRTAHVRRAVPGWLPDDPGIRRPVDR
jgi:hypothetical protein